MDADSLVRIVGKDVLEKLVFFTADRPEVEPYIRCVAERWYHFLLSVFWVCVAKDPRVRDKTCKSAPFSYVVDVYLVRFVQLAQLDTEKMIRPKDTLTRRLLDFLNRAMVWKTGCLFSRLAAKGMFSGYLADRWRPLERLVKYCIATLFVVLCEPIYYE